MTQEDSEEEAKIFTTRVKTLKHIAIDLSHAINAQNDKLNGLEPGFNQTITNLFKNIKNMKENDPKRFRAWVYFLGGTMCLGLLFFVLFILT
jgi:hypothetical protein